MHQWTAGRVVAAFRVRCQGPAEKRRPQIYRYTGEPDHKGAEEHALQTAESFALGKLAGRERTPFRSFYISVLQVSRELRPRKIFSVTTRLNWISSEMSET